MGGSSGSVTYQFSSNCERILFVAIGALGDSSSSEGREIRDMLLLLQRSTASRSPRTTLQQIMVERYLSR